MASTPHSLSALDSFTQMALFGTWCCGSFLDQPRSGRFASSIGSITGRPTDAPWSGTVTKTGKGDHRHVGGREGRYHFRNVEVLVYDFLRDIEQARRGKRP